MASKKGAKDDGLPGKPVQGGEYTRKRAVTLPALKLVEGVARYLKITGKMYVGSAQKAKPGSAEKAMEPATLAPAIDVKTGEVGVIIVGKVLQGVLIESYPADSYVGKAFEIVKNAKAAGKRYNTYSVFEIEA